MLLLCDPQEITRYALSTLAVESGLCPAGEVTPVPDLVALKRSLQELAARGVVPAVVMDYTQMSCTEDDLSLLHLRYPRVHFILFSDQLSRDFLRRMLLGSRHFSVVLKDSPLAELKDCLAATRRGEQYICPRILALLQSPEHSETERTPLTATEREILRAMSMGRSTKEIAAERFLSAYTVMTHRKNIFRKLRVNNAQEAIRYALRAGIVDPLEYYI